MDSNGRHRPSASTSSTPASGSAESPAPTIASPSSTSTFRRLPSLARPFRRNPDKGKDKEKEKEREREETIEEDPVTHQRTLLSRVLGEPSSAATISAASVFQHNTTPTLSAPPTSKRLDESTSTRSSGTSPQPPPDGSRATTTPTPNPTTPPVSPRKGSMQAAMSSALSPPIPVLSSQSIGDMEPITYPAHLAQRLPPEAGPSSGTSTPSPSSMTPSASGHGTGISTPPVTVAWPKYTNKQREYTMGTPIRYGISKGREDDSPKVNRHGHVANGLGSAADFLGPEPGPGGPPTGVPRRKESMIAQATEQARVNGSTSSTQLAGIARDKGSGTDTDSGGGEGSGRRRANTKAAPTLGPAIGLHPNDKDREKGKENEKEKENLPLSADKESHSRSRKVSRPAKAPLPPSYISRPSLPSARPMSKVSASSMYYSILPFHGRPPAQPLRAHTGTIVGNKIWLVGGMDLKNCWGGVAWYDTESLLWSTVETAGEAMPPLRAQTSTAVGSKLYLVCGGDGSHYTNETYIFDTESHRFSQPNIVTPREKLPPRRRAHTTVHYHNWLVVFGGGNGQTALNDIWALDISDPKRLTWEEWKTTGDPPARKGYHTANLVGDKMIVFGGSDGHASFADVHVLDLVTEVKHNRLAHTSTRVGSYLFILGGHDGHCYTQDVLLFNLVTLQWENKIAQGQSPPGRGYHVALLHDARIFVSGGYNGVSVFDDLWALDLGAAAYLPQVLTRRGEWVIRPTRHDAPSIEKWGT